MVSPEARLAELGIDLPLGSAPVAAYLPVVAVGQLVFVSGQLARADGQLIAHGRLGELGLELGQSCARQCALNVIAHLKSTLGSLERVKRVVKLTAFVASTSDFVDHHLVADGASALFADVFGEHGCHARTAVGVAALPLGSPVELEAIVSVDHE